MLKTILPLRERAQGRRCAVIHIGMPKTGTKSIQFALAQRRSKLAKAGWRYPLSGTTFNRGGHHALAWYLSGEKFDEPSLSRFTSIAFESEISDNLDIIVSSEVFFYFGQREDLIRSLLSLFAGREVFVVVYLREQADFLNSMYVETLKDLYFGGSIGFFAEHRLQVDCDNYHELLRKWRELLNDRLIVRPFGGNSVQDFSGLLGIDAVLQPLPTERRNQVKTIAQVAVLIQFIRTLKTRGESWEHMSERHRHFRKLASKLLDDCELKSYEPYWGLGAARVRSIRDRYREANATLGLAFSNIDEIPKRNAIVFSDLPMALRQRMSASFVRYLDDHQKQSTLASGACDSVDVSTPANTFRARDSDGVWRRLDERGT